MSTILSRRSLLTGLGASAATTAAVMPFATMAASAASPPVTAELLAAYNQWLFYERRLLCYALWGSGMDKFVPVGTAADSYHFPRDERDWTDVPSPVTRAALVLSAVGCDWTGGEDHHGHVYSTRYALPSRRDAHPDAELIELGREHQDAVTRVADLHSDYLNRRGSADEAIGPVPDALVKRDGTGDRWTADELRRYLAGEEVPWAGGTLRAATVFEGPNWAPDALPVAVAYERRVYRAEIKSGVVPAERRRNEAAGKAEGFGETIAKATGRTLDGYAVKASVLQATKGPLSFRSTPNWYDDLVQDVASGVIALARCNAVSA
jgi:hypothetical protein